VSVIESTGEEQQLIEDLALIEDRLHQIREKLRQGAAFSLDSSKVLMNPIGQVLQLGRV
jgi:hypothetical protein